MILNLFGAGFMEDKHTSKTFTKSDLLKKISELKSKDISMPRNPIISKLFRMVKLAENAGFGFDKIESNWLKYNKTLPEYDLAFDSFIMKLHLTAETAQPASQDDYGLKIEELRGNYGVNVDDLRGNYGERCVKILTEILSRPEITKEMLAEIEKVSVSTIEN